MFIAVTFLLFTKIWVLKKFGLMIQMTILYSIFYALLFMPALLYILGP